MKVLSDELSSQIRHRIRSNFHSLIDKCVSEADENKKSRPEQAEFFHGIRTAFIHSLIIFDRVMGEENFEAAPRSDPK